jgi:7-keto-8-aminopelargonate synthetase-like enzyme
LAAAGLAAIDVVRHQPERRAKLLHLAGELRRMLEARGFSLPPGQSQIVPVILGDAKRTMTAAAELRRRGYFVPGIRPPSVPAGQSLLRISLTCLHTPEHIDGLVAALAAVAK